MKLLFLCFIIGSSWTGLITCQNDDCLVQTKLGQIRGKVEESRGEKKFCSFLGIPFANPPQRFEEAKLKDGWDGILDAQNLGAECAQLSQGAVVGGEDCLFVNVFVPIGDQCPLSQQQQQQQDDNSTDNLASGLPVLVHIHGGSFTSGSGGLYGPKLWMDECVVYVSMNYRLGALGFLTMEDGLIPGNLGLKDQRLGLQWVQMNIAGFRGNPKMVTINGISAGACSVSHLVASKSAKGLFQRAIAQSGSAINPWGIAKNPGGVARRLGQRLNCSAGNEDKNISTAALQSCLLSKDFKEIVVNQHQLTKWANDPAVPFGPVVERLTAKNAFHRINPYYKIKLGAFNKVPLIQGFCEDEALVISENKILVSELNERWEELAPISFMYDEDYIPQRRKNEFSSKIRQFYFGGKNISEEMLQNVTNLYSDRAFVQGIFDNVESHARHAPVYPYVLTYKGAFSFAQLAGYRKPATTHGDDGQYFFNLDVLPPLKRGSADEKMSQNLIKLWMSFIRTGEPSETFPTSNLWKQYSNTRSGDLWLQLDSETQQIPNYLQTRRDFWKNLGLNAYDYPMF